MSRKPGHISPSDLHHVVKLQNYTWDLLGDEAMSRGMSKPKLAEELLNFMLENKEIIEALFSDDEREAAE